MAVLRTYLHNYTIATLAVLLLVVQFGNKIGAGEGMMRFIVPTLITCWFIWSIFEVPKGIWLTMKDLLSGKNMETKWIVYNLFALVLYGGALLLMITTFPYVELVLGLLQ